jgi:FMN phosphatase YigB (HAD superfamily)
MKRLFSSTRNFFIVFLCFLANFLQGANIVFDMDGVLVTQSTTRGLWEVGLTRFIGFYNYLRLTDSVYEFLELLMPYDDTIPYITHNGRRVPAILVKWTQGKITQEEVMVLIEKWYQDRLPATDSQRKLALIKEIVSTIFTPSRFVNMIVPVEKGIDLLKKCYHAKDSQGNRKNRVFILTNWDSRSFRLLAVEDIFAEFIDLCDGVIVSGDHGFIKPQPEIFTILFKECGIDPDNELTVIIDDNPENIAAMPTLHKRMLRGILCKKFNFKSVKKKLKELDVL